MAVVVSGVKVSQMQACLVRLHLVHRIGRFAAAASQSQRRCEAVQYADFGWEEVAQNFFDVSLPCSAHWPLVYDVCPVMEKEIGLASS